MAVKEKEKANTRAKGANGPEPASITRLRNKITFEQKKIDRNEGTVVVSLINIGKFLAELRSTTAKNWAKQLEFIGYSPRVARRYIQLGQSRLGEVGLIESDLVSRLPVDLLKLEWLCRLDRRQLQDLLEHEDCKKATRARVIIVVKQTLGMADATQPAVDSQVTTQKLLKRLRSLMDKAFEETTPEGRGHIRDVMAEFVWLIDESFKK